MTSQQPTRVDGDVPSALGGAVARVAVELALPHLDHPFDYLVPASLAARVQPGVRVRVRLAGQLLDGVVLELVDRSAHPGQLAPLARVVSDEPVLSPEIAALARSVADRYAGTLADVLRLALPPRHAGAERSPSPTPPAAPPDVDPTPWAAYHGGVGYLAAVSRGEPARAVWTALPGDDWAHLVAVAVQASLHAGRGAVVVVPDARDLDRVDRALGAQLGDGAHVCLAAELGAQERYRRWLAVRRGRVAAVAGTRAAMFAPVRDLGLVVIWDDGDDLHAEPRAPYAHVREVLLMRAHSLGAGALIGGFARTAEAAHLVTSGWARALAAERPTLRARVPLVQVAGEDAERERDQAAAWARLPSLAWRAAHDGLQRGPVLVQVPRAGYLPSLACATCRRPARCAHCRGPLALPSGAGLAQCSWCARPAGSWCCPHCGGTAWRAQVVGSTRTAEELGRAFPSVPVRVSGRGRVSATVGSGPALVVATPGAEPVADGGYAAALLLDGWALLARPDLRAGEETLRRWLNAAALVRPAADGGRVVVMADPGLAPVQALLRWDPGGHARRELAERVELHFPPAARVAEIRGSPSAVRDVLLLLDLPAGAEVLGPAPDPGEHPAAGDAPTGARALVRVPRAHGGALARALQGALGVRSARRATDPVRVRIDPPDLG